MCWRKGNRKRQPDKKRVSYDLKGKNKNNQKQNKSILVKEAKENKKAFYKYLKERKIQREKWNHTKKEESWYLKVEQNYMNTELVGKAVYSKNDKEIWVIESVLSRMAWISCQMLSACTSESKNPKEFHTSLVL